MEFDSKSGYLTRKDTDVKLARPMKVKNKSPAPIQITAEQILREARDYKESGFGPPRQKISDVSELDDYRLRKRKEFEDQVRRSRRQSGAVWVKYACWEERQEEFDRARSVWERAVVEVEYCRDHSVWVKYAEFEMRNGFVNHARKVWDRAVALLPRVDQLWYKWAHMEEMLGNVAGARRVFERWTGWMADRNGWLSYVKFELRYSEIDKARAVFERLVGCHPEVGSWIRYAKFEMKNGEIGRCRNVYERAVEKLKLSEELFVAFAEFEVLCKETERARVVYRFALDRIPYFSSLCKKYLEFEKRYGDLESIEDALMRTKRFEYDDEVRKKPFCYHAWLNCILLEESVGIKSRIREVYERATAHVPPADDKKYWQEYIYLWIKYALYEELDVGDIQRARAVYRECLNLIPHEKFSFAKIWLLAAQLEIRQLNLKDARLILGNAIGKAPKHKIFKMYIEIELQLGNIDRCRKLYEKYLEWTPETCFAWTKYAELEKSLSETERARSIFELAIAQPALDMPELLWKAYIDFEISEGEFERTRELFERLLDRTKHLKVWISYAKFEMSTMKEEQKKQCVLRVRRVFENAIKYYRTLAPESKEERAMLIEEWLNMEINFGALGDVSIVQAKLPMKLKRRRQILSEDGPIGLEEYVDYRFPEETQTTNIKILEAAYKWKKQKSIS